MASVVLLQIIFYTVFFTLNEIESTFPTCDEASVCGYGTYTCPTYKTGECNIICTGTNACVGAAFYCPQVAGFYCSLSISELGSATRTELHATQMIGGTLDIIIDMTNSLINALSSGTINCPIGGTCNIEINGKGIDSGVINATHSTQLNITISNAIYALSGTTVYCPDNGHNGEATCIITASYLTTGSEWPDVQIYAVEGFASDLQMTCGKSGECGTAILYCGKKYKYSCTITTASDYKYCGSNQFAICNTYLYPTPEPTAATSSPSPQATPSPIFSRYAVYIEENGADEDTCKSRRYSCATIDYAYDCIMGTKCDYSGTGTIYIGAGKFVFYGQHLTNYGDLIFDGNGSDSTLVYMNSVISDAFVWFGCSSAECWISLIGFTLYSYRVDVMDPILKINYGTLYVRDVVFDGDNFDHDYFFVFNGARLILFESCTFANLNTNFVFHSGATGIFKDCLFLENEIIKTDDYDTTVPFISVESESTLTFNGCTFDSNYLWRAWISVSDSSQITFNNTIISNNNAEREALVSFIAVEGSECTIYIIDSRFSSNQYFSEFIYLGESYNVLKMDNVIFTDNTMNKYDVRSIANAFNTIDITDSQFLNSVVTQSSIAAYALASITLSNTLWDHYMVASEALYVLHLYTLQNQVLFSRIQMSNIQSVGGMYIDSYASSAALTLSLTNCVFHNISALSSQLDADFIFVNGGLIFTNNKVSYVNTTILSVDQTIYVKDNIFEYNQGYYIIDYQSVFTPETSVYLDSNEFIANDGGIFNLRVNDSNTFDAASTNIYVNNITIRDYINPQFPLFVIVNYQESSCKSQGAEWIKNIPTFSLLNIMNNVNTQIISTICMQVDIDTVYAVNNTIFLSDAPFQSTAMFLFQEYTSNVTALSNFVAIDNQMIMIQIYDGITINNHNIQNHKGIYLYNRQTASDSAYYVNIILQNINISHSQSAYNPGLFYVIASSKQIDVNHIVFDGLYLYNNTGSLITIIATDFDTDKAAQTHTCPQDVTEADIIFKNTKIEHNDIIEDNTYLIGIKGANAWFNKDVVITNNDCGVLFDASCMLLLDGWYTLNNVDYTNNAVNDNNFIRFGHSALVDAYYDAQLCINYSLSASTTNVIEIATYIDVWYIDSPPSNGEKIYIYPCETTSKSDAFNKSFLYDIDMNHSQIFDYNTDGAHILRSTICNETDCQVLCSGSVSCFGSKIYCNSGVCNINCSEQYSCANIEIYTLEPDASVSVICDGASACSSARMEIYNASEFKLICGESSSCLETKVYISSMQNASSIYCHEYESCDSITISSTDRDITVFMYEYSSDITIETPTGYISDPDTNEENLVCGDPQQYVFWDSTQYSSVEAALKDHYNLLELPCSSQSITFHCTNFTDSFNETQFCVMGAEAIEDNNYALYSCYPLYVTSLIETYCDGSCPNSPTSAPTEAPTSSPTKITQSPSNTPTHSPTIAPSAAPTEAPTAEPTLAPSNSPIHPPSLAPIASPTDAPSATPSNAPSSAPSLSPTISPTHAPSRAPTIDGTYDSFIPITFVLYHLNNDIKSAISDYSDTSAIAHMQQIIERGYFDDTFLLYAQFAVYIDAINDIPLQDIDKTSWYKWGKETSSLHLESHIDCSKDLCVLITTFDMKTHDESEVEGLNSVNVNAEAVDLLDGCNAIHFLQLNVQCNLRNYFNHSALTFAVDAADEINSQLIECYDCSDESFDYLLTGIFGFLALMAILSVLAFLYNNQLFCTLPGFSPVDDAKWMTLMIFGIQVWDFISDMNLALEIWNDLNGNGIPDGMEENAQDITLEQANIFIIISGSGATLFVLMPYIVNIIIAANIKKMISQNDAAKAYFQYYAAVFVAFVVLSGGAYPALAVVSSGIFGLAVFNSGLTAYELRKLSKIKLFGTLILENLPQIGCQILYSWTIGNFTPNTQLAFCASLLSLTASTLSYYIERNVADTTAVSYYLSFECKQRGATSSRTMNVDDDISPYDVIDDHEIETLKSTQAYDKQGGEIVADHTPKTPVESAIKLKLGITEAEKDHFWRNKGLKLKLSTCITEVFGISQNNIEIGYVQITKYGIILHVIHYVYATDLVALERELSDEQINLSIGPSYYTEHCLYGSFTKEIDEIFANHFDVESDDFRVKYHKRYPIKKRKNKEDEDPVAGEPELAKKKSTVVRGMAMHLKKMQTLNVASNANKKELNMNHNDYGMLEMMNMNENIAPKLNKILANRQFASSEEEKRFVVKWMNQRYDNDRHENIEGKEADDSDDDDMLQGINTLSVKIKSTHL